MTRDEALKVIDLNIGRLNGSMQMAVKTLMEDGVRWRTAKAGRALNEDCLIIYQGEEARLGRVAVYDCHYLPVSDLTKYLNKEDSK